MEETSLLKQNMDFSKLKIADLKKELKMRGLSCTGNKTQLLERLQIAAESKLNDNESTEFVDDLDDDLLNDDDSDHDDPHNIVPSESVLKELDEQLDVPSPINVTKRPLENDSLISKPSKKFVLNRKLSATTDSNSYKPNELSNIPTTEPQKANETSNEVDVNEKKVIKLTNLTTKERLDMRAKKFGALPSVEAKKIARLERFGASTPNTSTGPAITKATTNLDALKKRAERFGGSVSKAISGLEQQQRLELRKARFGGTSISSDDKAKQRLERFKTPVM